MVAKRRNYRLFISVLIVYIVYKTFQSFNNDNQSNSEIQHLEEKTREKGLKKEDFVVKDESAKKANSEKQHAKGKNSKVAFYQDTTNKISLTQTFYHFKGRLKIAELSTPQLLRKSLHSSKTIWQIQNLARLFENCFPNTLDTTILYHYNAETSIKPLKRWAGRAAYRNDFSETFVITGDIHAEWLRDSAWQLSVYQPLIKYDPSLKNLIKGAINTQSHLLMSNPYCNAFKAPFHMKVPNIGGQVDHVFPRPNWREVFECKYEIDSLASFLTLSRQYYENSEKDYSFMITDWFTALLQVMTVIRRETVSTYEKGTHDVNPFGFIFQRDTNSGSETRPLAGTGNPVQYEAKLVRSAFRPSDDVTIFQYFIPGNAYLSVELTKMAKILKTHAESVKETYQKAQNLHSRVPYPFDDLVSDMEKYGEEIKAGIYEKAVFQDSKFGGDVLAFEVDGYGSRLVMDDANIPSLLSLPDLGFIEKTDPLYINTRKMILSPEGNPYAKPDSLYFPGIGSPHTGIHSVWPMSLTTAIRTSTNEDEIQSFLKLLIENTNGLGLMHESINAYIPNGEQYTRPWFAWANSEFAKTIMHLAKNHPALVLKPGVKFSLDSVLSESK
ncbi:hypothetical protein ACO0QE_004465 [Hanseniaspora vineae]